MNRSIKEELIEGDSCPHSVSIDLCETLRTRQLLIDFDGNRPILSLRAPLDLVNFPSVSRPRWPTECEVISDVIHHIGNVKYYLDLYIIMYVTDMHKGCFVKRKQQNIQSKQS